LPLGARLSVSSRFLLVLGIGLVLQAGISVGSLLLLKQSLQQDRINEVKHLLESAYSTVVFYHDQADKGLLTDAQAQQAAAAAIRAMRYDGTNYFCIWNLNGTGVAHGGNPKLEGRTFVNSPDASKNPMVAYMVGKVLEAVKNDAHEGLSRYRIPKAGQSTPLDKIAYSKLFEPWGWSLTTGAYIDDIDRTFWSRALSVLVITILLTVLAGAATFYLGRDLSRAINRLTTRVTGVALGELDGDVPEIQRSDEVGVMARALLVLRDTSREAAELRLDQLTGLPTRKLLMDRLRQAKALSARERTYGGVILIDLDKFKSLNDTHGHDAGDALTHAQILVAFAAKFTLPACPVHPGHANPVADVYILHFILHCGAPLHHTAYDFVSEDQRFLYDAGKLRPVAIGHVQIGMTDAANLHLDQDLVRGRLGPGHILQR